MKKQWRFILATVIVMAVMVMGGCGGGTGDGNTNPGGDGAVTYSISGTITIGGSPLAGVTVSTGGGFTTTDPNGNYTISALANGRYTLTPSKVGHTFTPVNLTVTVDGANAADQNFTATAVAEATYSISGTITSGGTALAGAAVILSGRGTTAATTDSSGNYCISDAQNGNYTLTPAKTGYTFTPATLAVTVSGASLTGKNFTATANSGVIQLPRTGDAYSYPAGADGALQKGAAWPVPRFSDNANGTVTDNLTGLIWLKNSRCFTSQNWSSALNSANLLASNACGLSDGSTAGQWRLPNINELESLVDVSQLDGLASGHPFTTPMTKCWSSTSDASSADSAWIADPGTTSGFVRPCGKVYGNAVWPVRDGQSFAATIALPVTGQTACYDTNGSVISCAGTGQDGDKLKGVAAPSPRFTDNANGTVTDSLTGLIWLKNTRCFTSQTWSSALNSANLLANNACGLTDGSTAGQWRLPNRNELMSLVDRSESDPALSVGHPFTSVQSSVQSPGYWSSSSEPVFCGAWVVYLDSGSTGHGEKGCRPTAFKGFSYVWPVRDGQ